MAFRSYDSVVRNQIIGATEADLPDISKLAGIIHSLGDLRSRHLYRMLFINFQV